MNILITGIHGFVGSNLVASLKAQHTIYGLDIVSPQKAGVEQTYGWNELEKIPPVDAVIHLAGKAHDTRNTAAEQKYFDINLGLTQRIFEYFLQSGATKFIFFSSVKAVADQVEGDFLTEEVIPAPKGPYGESKLAAEKYLSQRLHEYTTKLMGDGAMGREGEKDKKVYILRPCMIHGPGNKGNLNLLYKLVQKGIPWSLGAFENKRSFTSIDNLSYLISQLIEKDIEPGIYQVADDDALSTNEIIHLIAASQGRKSSIWNISKKMISLLAKTGDIFHLPLTSERFTLWNFRRSNSTGLKKLTESYVVSNQKIKKALGIERMPITSKEGLKKTFESFQGISN